MSVVVSHLYKSIGKTQILRDISLQVGDGEVVGLLGPNGAGKTTLMKILTGLWDFQQGQVEVCDIKAKNGLLPHSVSRYIGYLPENNPLYDDMYVTEYLRFMANISDLSDKVNFRQLIDRIGLQPMAHKKIRELSKGYRQRVGLAQAIMSNPRLVILDEPTTGLDPNQLDEIRNLIRDLGQDRTVILSTHIMQEVCAVCNRAVIIANGEIREDTRNLEGLEELFREKTK